MKYKHLSLKERELLYGMLEKGFSHRKIAEKLGRKQSSISREVRKNTKYGKKYIPCIAQARAKRVGDRQRYKAPLKSPQVFLYVREHLRLGWSPQTISGRISLDIPSSSITPEAIYRYIYLPKNKKYNLSKYLVRKHRRRAKLKGRKVHKSKIPNRVSIDNRAKYINKRIQLGHWESDLMEGPRSSKQVLSVTTERATRYTLISKLPNKKSESKTKDISKRMRKLPAQVRRSITLDNGIENFRHEYMSKLLGAKVFFCHPYHSWEKGTVENTIGVIRRYLPKGTDLRNVSKQEIVKLEYILNNTPRKCLGYLTPNEKMMIELKKQTVST